MLRVLHAEQAFSSDFINCMLTRNIRVGGSDRPAVQLREKRLARTLLLLAHYGSQDRPDSILPKVSQETLAEMVGTTRSRVNFFMNKFRKLALSNTTAKSRLTNRC
jgi:CRP-like cAMP-binding protein